MIVDYHLHLRGPTGPDGAEPLAHTLEAVERYVEVALACGVDELCFTEHVYYFRQTRDVWHLPYHLERCRFDLDGYVEVLAAARGRGLPVKLGLEVDRVGERQEHLAELLAPYPWDLLLGSVHEIEAGPIDLRPGAWGSVPVDALWREYFAGLAELAASGCVDVIAHPDLAKIYGLRPEPELVAELHEQAAAALGRAGVAVEISTAGLRKPVGELYPDASFLAALARRGVPITIASDAHAAELVGEDFDRALALARGAGYETVSVFDGRRRRQEPLG